MNQPITPPVDDKSPFTPAPPSTSSGQALPPCSPALFLTRRLPSLICVLLIVAFAIFFSALAIQQHRAFQTNGLDLGNVDQALWNTAQGRFLNFTLMTPIQSRLALHVEPILLLLVPLYWLGLGGPETLLIIQATVVAIGAWPLYQLSLCNFQFSNSVPPLTPHAPRTAHHAAEGTQASPITHLLPLTFPLAYLLLPTLESAVLFDFHAVTLAPTFLLFTFWALERKKDAHFIIFSLLAMACKEDVPLVVAALGLYVGLAHRRWRLAGLTIGLSAAWFVTAVFFIQPRFAPGGNIQLERYAWLGHSPPAMMQTLVTQPGLVFSHLWYQADLPGYLAALFFPTAFLALFSPLTLLPMLPTLAVNLLSDNPFTWRLEDFHYGAMLAPFLLVSAIYGIRRLGELASRRISEPVAPSSSPPRSSASLPLRPSTLVTLLALLLLTFSFIYHYHRGFTPFARPFIWPQVTAHHRQLEQLLQTIPAGAALFTQSNLAPHLTQRPVVYTDFGYFTGPNFPAPTPVDDILLDVTAFENFGGLHQFLRQTLLESGHYRLVAARDGLLHLRPVTTGRQPPPPTPYSLLPTPFYTFVQPDTPPDYPLSADFGDVVRLHGYSLHFSRQEEIQVSLDLEPLQPLADIQPVLYLLDAAGQPAGATVDLQPALVWYPPDQWPVGNIVRVRFNTFPWYTRQTRTYRLALGLAGGNEVWNVGRRQRPAIIGPIRFATRLPAGGTLLELARIEQVWGIPQGGPPVRQFSPPPIPRKVQANFDNEIRLLGYSMSPLPDPQSFDLVQVSSRAFVPSSRGDSARGDRLQHNSPGAGPLPPTLSITLYWQAISTPPALTRFVQLIGPDGLVYGQNDSAPDYGNYPTNLWQPGEVVADTVTLAVQAESPAGNYTLHIGLYRPETGQRLPLLSGGDHVELAKLIITGLTP